MLAPRASSAFVCIRCELKLSQPRVSFARPSHASFSSASRRDAFDDVDLTRPPRPRSALSARPLGKLTKRKGRAVRESTPQLDGVKSLGKDAKILVLQELGYAQQGDSGAVAETVADEQNAPKILASLQAEAANVSQEEINQQLQQLCPMPHSEPTEPRYITQAAFKKLNKIMNKSFTVQQLSRYYSVNKGVQEDLVKRAVLEGLKRKGTGKHAVDRTLWYPGTTALHRRLPSLSVASKGPKRKPLSKPLLVDSIIRDVWNVVLLEEIEAPGEVEFTLKTWQLSLLNAGAESALDEIGAVRKAKIEIYWPHNTLRITADKSSAEYAADDVEQRLKGTELLKFKITPWQWLLPNEGLPRKLVDLFSHKGTQLVGNISGTVVQAASDDLLLIRGLNKASTLEAQRLLVNLLPIKPNYSRTIDAQTVENADQSYLSPVDVDASLDHRLRDAKFGRWTLPIAENAAATTDTPEHTTEGSGDIAVLDDTSASASYEQVLSRLQQFTKSLSLPQSINPIRSRSSATWHVQPDTQLTAEFGQVLFPRNAERAKAVELAGTAFTNVIPGISKMLAEANLRAPGLSPPYLDYEFIPSIEDRYEKLERSEDYPSLTLRFQAEGQPKLLMVALQFNEHYHDVLLPHKASDIRFKTHQRLRLRNAMADTHIAAFVEAVYTNIQSGGRLSAPPHLNVQIPKWTLPGHSRDDPDSQVVVYSFSGIKYRQIFNAEYQHLPIAYATVQSGKLHKKSGQLSTYLHHYQPKGKPGVDTTPRLEAFVKTSFEVAQRLTKVASNDQSVAKLVLPRMALSERKLRREGEREGEVDDADNRSINISQEHPVIGSGDVAATEIEGDQHETIIVSADDAIELVPEEGQQAVTVSGLEDASFRTTSDIAETFLGNIIYNGSPEPNEDLPTQNFDTTEMHDDTPSLTIAETAELIHRPAPIEASKEPKEKVLNSTA